MLTQLSRGFSTIVDGFWKIVFVVSDTLNPLASSKKEQNSVEHQLFLQDLENKKKAIKDLKLLQQEKLAAMNALVASAKATQQELGNATLLVDKKLNEKQSLIQSVEELSPQINRLSVERRRQERKVADLTLKIEMKEMAAKEAESLKPSDHFQQLLNNAKLIEQRDYKQKLAPKVKSKQEILEEKKINVENLKLQQKNKIEKLNSLVAHSEMKQQELSNVTSAAKQKSAEKQFLVGRSERLSAQINNLYIEKQLQERKAADLTLKIDRREMEAEFRKSLLEQQGSRSAEPNVTMQEPVVQQQSEPVIFVAPEAEKKTSKNSRSVALTAASFREKREKKQTDFFMHAKPKNNNKKKRKRAS